MSDRFAAQITVGGTIKRSLVEELCGVISQSGAGPDWEGGCEPQNEADLLELVGENGTMVLHDCQACYGQFDDLEQFLEEHEIPFDRHSEAKYEYDGELVKYRPGHGCDVFEATQDGRVCVKVAEVEDIVRRLDSVETLGKRELLRLVEEVRDDLRGVMAMDVPPVPPFVIVEG